MMKKSTSNSKKIAVLISGSGTNLQAIIDSCQNKIIMGLQEQKMPQLKYWFAKIMIFCLIL